MFCEKSVLRNFAKFVRKHLCQSVFFNKVAGAACNFIKRETLAQVFSCEFCKISKNTFFYRTPPVAASLFCKTKILRWSSSLISLPNFWEQWRSSWFVITTKNDYTSSIFFCFISFFLMIKIQPIQLSKKGLSNSLTESGFF